jgi:cytoskeletal protein CcmA (bactofilin family)
MEEIQMGMFTRNDEAHDHKEDAEEYRDIDTILGRGDTFKGSAHIDGALQIEGALDGDAVCSGVLTVTQEGTAEADLRADEMVIAGMVVGDIIAEKRVTLHETARLQGTLKAMALVVTEGAALRAECDIGNHPHVSSLSGEETAVPGTDEAA